MGMSYADALLLYFLLWIILIAILWWRELSRVKSFERSRSCGGESSRG